MKKTQKRKYVVKSVKIETPKSESPTDNNAQGLPGPETKIVELSDEDLQKAIKAHCEHSYNLLKEFCKRNGLKAESFLEKKIKEIKERK